MYCGYFDTTRKGNHSTFLTPTVVGGRRLLQSEIFKVIHPFEKRRLREISAYNVSTLRFSEKSSIMTNRKWTTCVATSYKWSAYVTTRSPKNDSKIDIKINFIFNRIKSATKFVCVKTSTGKLVI